MRKSRGAYVVMILALGTLCILVSFQGAIREQVHLWRLESRDRDVQGSAAEALIEVGTARSVPGLFRALCATGGNDLHDLSFAPYFRAIVARGETAIPYLISRLKIGAQERFMSLGLLSRITEDIGERARVALPQLVNLIAGKEAEERMLVAVCINNIGVDPGPEAVHELCMRLRDPRESSVARANTLDLFRRVRPASEEVVSALEDVLKDDNADFRVMAIEALKEYGQAARMALPALRALGGDENQTEEVKQAVAEALRAMER